MKNRIIAAALALLACASGVRAQGIPTGTISGRVTSQGQGVAGVAVEATSASLQGRRTTVTGANGDYSLPLLPPGEYTLAFVLEGLEPANRAAKISAAQDARVDVEMGIAAAAESVTVTATADTISTSSELSSTYTKQLVEQLPTGRNIRDTIQLAPGISATGPGSTSSNQAITIAGAQSYENLFLIDGVVVNENLRGQPLNLFVEDAIEETTASISGISAEYGRFAGGVINTITKSGGNEFHGSLRDVVTNDSWTAPTPVTVDRVDKVNSRYEATLGGRVVRDRLWFFGTGRQFDISSAEQTAVTNIPYVDNEKQLRGQLKLTLAATDSQRLIGTYSKIDDKIQNDSFATVLDLESLKSRELPQTLWAANYNGVFGSNFYLTAQYSRREFSFVKDGGLFTDRIRGTVIRDGATDFRMNAPTFCGVCRDEGRNNDNILAKASYFLSTENAGSHELAMGVDRFTDIREADNHQSASDFMIFSSTESVFQGDQVYPVFFGDGSAAIVNYPILQSTKGTNFRTNSVYLNDKWRASGRLSFNLGLRYDKNDGDDSVGHKVASDSRVSPRLGVAYDLKGDGDWILNASAGDYVTAIANTIADASSPAGNPAILAWVYFGPDINVDPSLPLVSKQDALRQIFTWFDSVGGVNNSDFRFLLRIPGETSIIRDSLRSPYTREYSLGLGKRLGDRGAVRADLVRRESHDFYTGRIDTGTGRVIRADGSPADLEVIENANDSRFERTYTGLLTQFQYRPSSRLNFGGSYTLSRTYGNVNGETTGSGPVRSTVTQYPEYKDLAWNSPKGDLATDQRHRLRLWGTFEVLHGERQKLTASVLQSYFSGTPYGAVGAVDSRQFVTNPGYAQRPTSVTYYFTERDAFHTPDLYPTDISFNYSFFFKTGSRDIELFLQPQVLNVFNQKRVVLADTSVIDATQDPSYARFNPFTTTPVEGVNWAKADSFGKGVSPGDFQTPRTFRLSLGIRF